MLPARHKGIAVKKPTTISGAILVTVLIACPLLQGCVGVVTFKPEGQTFEPAVVTRSPATYSVSKTPSKDATENPTTVWLKEHWGQPSQITQLTGPERCELWTYNFSRDWCGVMPCLIIPIPLLLPVGRDHVVFRIRGGRVENAEVTTLGGYQAVAGLGPEGPYANNGHWH
jgi:hypothetical protein